MRSGTLIDLKENNKNVILKENKGRVIVTMNKEDYFANIANQLTNSCSSKNN